MLHIIAFFNIEQLIFNVAKWLIFFNISKLIYFSDFYNNTKKTQNTYLKIYIIVIGQFKSRDITQISKKGNFNFIKICDKLHKYYTNFQKRKILMMIT